MGVLSQSGRFLINNGFEAKLVVDFDVADRHIWMAAPYFGQAWANEALIREPGVFVFRVI